MATQGNKGGRPPHPIRSEFIALASSGTVNRPGAKCKHCPRTFTPSQAKKESLLKHITQECTKVPKDVRDKWLAAAADGLDQCTDGEDAVQLGKRVRDSVGSSSSSSSSSRQLDLRRFGIGHNAQRKEALTKDEKQRADSSLLRYMVCHNVPFSSVDSPHLAQCLATLCPSYKLPSPTTLKEKLLPAEYAAVVIKQRAKIAKSQNLTMALDGWTDQQKRAILAFVVLFPDRTATLLETQDVSDIIHSAENVAGGQGSCKRAPGRRASSSQAVCKGIAAGTAPL
jgi:hypothetical protein